MQPQFILTLLCIAGFLVFAAVRLVQGTRKLLRGELTKSQSNQAKGNGYYKSLLIVLGLASALLVFYVVIGVVGGPSAVQAYVPVVAFLGLAVVVSLLLYMGYKTFRELHERGKLRTFAIMGIPVFLAVMFFLASFAASRGGHDILWADLVFGAGTATVALALLAMLLKKTK